MGEKLGGGHINERGEFVRGQSAPAEPANIVEKIDLSAQDKEVATAELGLIAGVLDSLENGDPDSAYADTSDSIDTIDGILGSYPAYATSLPDRMKASRKIIEGDTQAKKEGLRDMALWLKKIKDLIS